MKPKDIAELLNEPACEHNRKVEVGCATPEARIDRGRLRLLTALRSP